MGRPIQLTMTWDSPKAKEIPRKTHLFAKSQRNQTSGAQCACLFGIQEIGRGEEIRTPDILLPKQARYQTALHPD